uniref:AncD1D2 n=1 Tax=synthetic construct TaxID=32630 RepID=UPI003AFB824B
MDETDEDEFTPRPYQVELLERAMKKNTIVCLGTGSGKTFIAVMLIKELAHEIRGPFNEGGKRTFFLVNTVPLVNQQAKVIRKHTSLKVGEYVGDMGVDSWNKEKWNQEFEKHQVLVMTAQIFLDILNHGFISLSQVNLLIFDECHHAVKNHPYRQIMRHYKNLEQNDRPRILGLTASVINSKCKPNQVEKKIKELEATLNSRVVTASDLEEVAVQKYATKPKEIIVSYNSDRKSDTSEVIENIINQALEQLSNIEETSNLNDTNSLKQIKKVLRDIKNILDELGPWCAHRVIKSRIRQLEKRESETAEELRTIRELLQSIFEQIINVLKNLEKLQKNNSVEFVSPKVKKLLEILKQYFSNNNNSSKELCGIIFVERRYTAYVLYKLLNELSAKRDDDFSFIKCDFVVGHNSSPSSKEKSTEMNSKKQKEVLKKFRKGECNLLVATSVVEEGIDIPKCNLVVRFDLPKNFRSYVQSKGRARAKNSKYIIMVEEDEKNKFQEDLNQYQEIEKILLRLCHNRDAPSEEDFDSFEDELLPPYMPYGTDGPRVTMSSAISLLHRYCSKLPSDRFTTLTPKFTYIEQNNEEENKMFRCTLRLPINSPLREPITGQPMPSKKLAKRSAALEACKKLHEMGELDDHLLPVKISRKNAELK